jgi:copper/silver efflux system protein
LQDWYLRYALASVQGVAEVASIGGFVKQYQVNIDPNRLGGLQHFDPRRHQPHPDVQQRCGGAPAGIQRPGIHGARPGIPQSVEDIGEIAVGNQAGTPILVRDIAQVTIGPDIRRGIVELDGLGEVAGGVVVIRFGENALNVINAVKAKIAEITPGLPEGVKIVPTYDRSELIQQSIRNLQKR